MKKEDCIIVDLEGTLTNHFHRLHHYNNKDYEAWNELFPHDPVNEEFIMVMEDFPPGIKVVLCTAKEQHWLVSITKWLASFRLSAKIAEIYCRPDGDKRSSVVVKEELLARISANYNVIRAYDDRVDIREMLRKHGIKAPDWNGVEKKDSLSTGYLEEINKTLKRATKAFSEPLPVEKITLSDFGAVGDEGITPLASPFKAKLPSVPYYLRKSADAFEERNKTYGSSYEDFGGVVAGLFPGGVKLETESDMARYGVLTMMMAKLQRYCNNFSKGGHEDSLVDLSTYAAMLNELDQKE